MQPRGRMIFALTAGVIVIVVSVLVSYVCFKILESSAEADLDEWKLGGAFAGFVFTASILTSIVFQFYKQMTSETLDSYREQIQELQTKLIKGAPCPEGFTVDIDERHNLVFARPETWTPKGGLLYQYVEPLKKDDPFVANFNVTYWPQDVIRDLLKGEFDPDNVDLEVLYNLIGGITSKSVEELLPGYEKVSEAHEYVHVDGLRSLKHVHSYRAKMAAESADDARIEIRQTAVTTYVPRKKALYQFVYSDDSKDYLASSEVFNQVTSSIRFL